MSTSVGSYFEAYDIGTTVTSARNYNRSSDIYRLNATHSSVKVSSIGRIDRITRYGKRKFKVIAFAHDRRVRAR